MLDARKHLHLSQIALASLAGVSVRIITCLEKLHYPAEYPYQKIMSIAGVLEIDPEQIMPKSLAGWRGQTKFLVTAEVSVDRLLEYQADTEKHFMLPSPDKSIEKKDDIARIKQMAKKFLTKREEQIIVLRYGLNGGCPLTKSETARNLNVTQERIGQIEAKSIRKLQGKASSFYWMDEINRESIDHIE